MKFVQIFSTGGTIDKIYFDACSEYEVGEPQIDVVFGEARVNFDYRVVSLMRKDSLEINDDDRALIRKAVDECEHHHILITHGTDTMTQTALVLEDVALAAGKVVVLTGAMAPVRFRQSDAEFNIGSAVGALNSMPPGVYIAMNGRIFKSGGARKNRQAGCFEEI